MDQPEYRTVDPFDRAHGVIAGLPDTLKTKPTTVMAATPLVGDVRTFVVQTVRREEGDTIFLQCLDAAGQYRLVIPPKVATAIARQRDALTARSRSRAAKQKAADRKARGELPGFMGANRKK